MRIIWLATALTAAVVLTALAAVQPLRPQGGGRHGRQSLSASVGPVSSSVIASWQAHGADDYVLENAPPDRPLPPSPIGRDWLLDLMVLWRWPGPAPELAEASVGDEIGGAANVHRLLVGDREFHVQFDPEAGTARLSNGAAVTLNGANVLMLDIGVRDDISVAGTATVAPRYPSDTVEDPARLLIRRSPAVTAFVNRSP